MNDESERLAPPPFWRTRYFAFDVLSRRAYLDIADINRIMARPERREVQQDGRIRLWGFSEAIQSCLRAVLLADGGTVHNAFEDEGAC